MSSATKPIKVFCSYSHQDEELRKALRTHLSPLIRQGLIEEWHDRCITAGQEWEKEIDQHLEAAQLILLLISADFLASDYCYDVEVKRALEQHEAGEAQVIPIILRPTDWKHSPFGKLQGLPTNAKPVTQWPDQDEAFIDIARGIRQVARELLHPAIPKPAPPQSTSAEALDKPIKIFYSYSHEDEALRERLETHLELLRRQGIIAEWHDRCITASYEWKSEVDQHLEAAQLILLLISAYFVASDYCFDVEMERALERHEAGEARVIPIILRSSVWQGTPFGKLQCLPTNAKPVTQWPDQDEAFVDIAQGIRKAAHASTALSLCQQGRETQDCGNYNEALNLYQKALAIFRTLGDRAREAAILTDMAQTCNAKGDYTIALDYLLETLDIWQVIGDSAREATALNDIGELYYAHGKRTAALSAYERALIAAYRIEDKEQQLKIVAKIEPHLIIPSGILRRLSPSSQVALLWAEGFRQVAGSGEIYTEYLLAGLCQEISGPAYQLLTLFDDVKTLSPQLESLTNGMTGTAVRFEDAAL